MIRNINENLGDPVEFDSLREMEREVTRLGYMPEDGLKEGRDYIVLSRPYYGVFYTGGGRDVRPELISKHWTLSGAERAYRKRNWWLFQRDRAARAGLSNCSTFDAVYRVNEEGEIERNYDFAPDF